MTQTEPPFLWLDRALVESLLDPDAILDAVQDAYVALEDGRARKLPVVREPLGDGNWFGLRGAMWQASEIIGLKASCFISANRQSGLESHQATILLLDAGSGMPLALVDGNHITHARTAAAGVAATLALARPDARSILLVGAGRQAEAQILAHDHALRQRNPSFLVAHPRGRADQAQALVTRLTGAGIDATVAESIPLAAGASDVVITVTPSTKPVLRGAWLRPGTHVNAIGSDAPGKRELDDEALRMARFVADDREQSRRFGEGQYLSEDHLTSVETLGSVLRGTPQARRNDHVTIFDSTGLGIHDVVSARLAYTRAMEGGLGTRLTR